MQPYLSLLLQCTLGTLGPYSRCNLHTSMHRGEVSWGEGRGGRIVEEGEEGEGGGGGGGGGGEEGGKGKGG